MSMQGDFIGLMFSSRNIAHKAHLTTNMYSRHMALGSFYSDIIDLADSFAETWTGRNGFITDINLEFEDPNEETSGVESDMEEPMESGGDVIAALRSHLAWIEANRNTIVSPADSPLQNIMDEIASLYLSTLYKLERLV